LSDSPSAADVGGMKTDHRPRRRVPLVMATVTGVLIAAAAILDWPKSEPQARRQLSLRAAELEAWLREELLSPIERPRFAEVGGAEDGAAAWRTVIDALAREAARSLADGASLPPLPPEAALRSALDEAIAAERFSAHDSLAALEDEEWLRGAQLFATLLSRSTAPADGALADWLDAAVVFAADLRSCALLEPALHAARVEDAVAQRLRRSGEPLGESALLRLRDHALAARGALPPASLLAERESRFVQALLCGRAGISPFWEGGSRRASLEPAREPLPLIATAAAVGELERYDELLAAMLAATPAERARRDFEQFAWTIGRVLPQAVPLLADGALLEPVRDAARRLESIVAAAEARLPGVDRSERRQ
jgi:hypothetical protein